MTRWLIWGGFAVAWTVILLLPGSEYDRAGFDEVSFTVKAWITKSGHVLCYALFAVLTGWLRVPARYRWAPLFLIMTHATVTELIQYRFPALARTGCLEDVCLNDAGILLGLSIGWKWWTDPK